MKILYIGLVELGIHNAQRAHVLEVCKQFHEQGHDVLLLAPKPRKLKETFPFRVVFVPFWGFGSVQLFAFYACLAFYVFYFILAFKPDCVYERELETLLPASIAFMMKIPVFVEVNGWAVGELEDLKTAPRKILRIKAVQRKKFHQACGLIAIVTNIKENIIREYNTPAEKIIVLPNGANTLHFYPVKKEDACGKLGLSSDTPYLGYVGNFHSWHGLNILIKAFYNVHQKNPKVTLIMAGTGRVFEECKSLVQKFNLTSSVIFTGQLAHDRIPLLIGAFDICLYTIKPGQTVFGSPLKMWEYLACGRPIISHLLPESPVPEQLHEAIFVVPPESPEALAEAVITLIHDPERRVRTGNKGREIAEKYFSWKSIVKRKLFFMEERMDDASLRFTKTMKILYLALVELEVYNAPRTHTIEVCENLTKLGHEVLLLVPKPRKKIQHFPFTMRYVPFFGWGHLREFIFHILLSIYLFFSIQKFKPDVVYERMLGNPLCLKITKFFRIKHVLEVNGHPYQNASDFQIKRIQSEFIRTDKIIVPSLKIKNHIQAFEKLNDNKIQFVPNGVNPHVFFPRDKKQARQELAIPTETFYIGYTGELYYAYDFDFIFSAMDFLQSRAKNIKLFIAGHDYKKACPANVIFHGNIPYEKIPLYINSFDVCLYPRDMASLQEVGILSTKIFEYISCGKRVLVPEVQDDEIPVSFKHFLIPYKYGDLEDFVSKVCKLHDSINQHEVNQEKIDVFIKEYSWEETVKKIISHIR